MTVSNDYEIEFGGINIADGDRKIVTTFDPFESPRIRSSDTVRSQDDGMFPGVDYYGERIITLVLELWGEAVEDFYAAYQQVLAACVLSRTEKKLEFKIPGWSDTLTVKARCRKVSGLIVDQRFDLNVGQVVLQFVTTDPRILAGTIQSSTIDFTGTQPGRVYNLTFDRNYGGIVSSNIVNATNSGSYDAPWTARIDGPVTNPRIEHSDLGKTLSFTGVVGAGEFLVVSSAPYKTIMLGGTATRYNWLVDSTQWFMLRPGNNSIRFAGTSAGTPTMTFSWQSAWV